MKSLFQLIITQTNYLTLRHNFENKVNKLDANSSVEILSIFEKKNNVIVYLNARRVNRKQTLWKLKMYLGRY